MAEGEARGQKYHLPSLWARRKNMNHPSECGDREKKLTAAWETTRTENIEKPAGQKNTGGGGDP